MVHHSRARPSRRSRCGLALLGVLLLACEPQPDKHSAAPASAEPEAASRGHVHLAATRVAESTRAELDTLLLLDSARARPRISGYLANVSETLSALRDEMTYFSMADSVWMALADSVSRDVRAIEAARDPYSLLAVHGDRFRRLLDHTEELHDGR